MVTALSPGDAVQAGEKPQFDLHDSWGREVRSQDYKGRLILVEGNRRYCSTAFDTKGGLWVSYIADTEQGRQVRTVHPE